MQTSYKSGPVPTPEELDAAMARGRQMRAEMFGYLVSAAGRRLGRLFGVGRPAKQEATHWTGVRPWGPSPTL